MDKGIIGPISGQKAVYMMILVTVTKQYKFPFLDRDINGFGHF